MRTWLRLLVVTLSVGGGFTGLVVTVQAMSASTVQGPATVAIFVGFIVLYSFVLASGLLLVHNARWVTPSIVSLAIQVPIVSSPVIAYRLTSGLDVSAAVSGGELVLSYHFGSFAQFNYLQQLPFALGVNVVALILVALTTITAARARLGPVVSPEPQSAAA